MKSIWLIQVLRIMLIFMVEDIQKAFTFTCISFHVQIYYFIGTSGKQTLAYESWKCTYFQIFLSSQGEGTYPLYIHIYTSSDVIHHNMKCTPIPNNKPLTLSKRPKTTIRRYLRKTGDASKAVLLYYSTFILLYYTTCNYSIIWLQLERLWRHSSETALSVS